jgi:hypothetical protein
MYEELVLVRGIVDLPAHDALEEAQAFLTQQGYTTVGRASDSLTVQRHPADNGGTQYAPNLTVKALPHPEGGVQLKVRGTDREGVQERQAAWVEWSEDLPKRPGAGNDEPEGHQERTMDTPDAALLPPREEPEAEPRTEPRKEPSAELAGSSPPLLSPQRLVPPPPGREPKAWRRVGQAVGGGGTMEREARLALGISLALGILLALSLYALGLLPAVSKLPLLGSGGYALGSSEITSEEVVQAFRDEGLEVGESHPVEEEDPSSPTFSVPKTYKEATRFEIPSLGEDKGGRVFTFETRRDVERVRTYYEGFSGEAYSHVFVKDDVVLVQINGELPVQEAGQYRAVLETM